MWSFIQAAGWPVWPLIFTSIAALGIIFERAWATRRERIYDETLLNDVLSSAQRSRSATELGVLAEGSLLGLVLASGFACRQRDRAHLREAFEVAGHKAAAALEKNLSLLSMIATVAPLMGLLGTVVGMIEVFGSQSSLGADPQALAHGISVALYNTAFGLVIAIPAAVAHRFFRIRADEYLQQLEDAARALLDRIVVHAAPRPPAGQAAGASRAATPAGSSSPVAPAAPGARSPSAYPGAGAGQGMNPGAQHPNDRPGYPR